MDYQSKQKIKGKTILITGGTGSFGSAMVQYLLKLAPKKVIIYSRDELKQFEMRTKNPTKKLTFVIGDIRDEAATRNVMKGVDFVFHAAALKQVPTAEFFPMEAVKTNILGSQNVIESAIHVGVKRVVFLSTDKAVYPINAMGMSKAIMEKLVASQATHDFVSTRTTFCVVRYGNVLFSRGSVVPLFVQQIVQGKKLTITDPLMTRFLMTLEDAVGLVLFALTHGKNGSIYVKKAPAANIQTIANAVCQLFAVKEASQIVGLRAGEKYHETLISQEEWRRVRDVGSYYHIPAEAEKLDYERFFSRGVHGRRTNNVDSYTSANTNQLSVRQTMTLLQKVPEVRKEVLQWKKK